MYVWYHRCIAEYYKIATMEYFLKANDNDIIQLSKCSNDLQQDVMVPVLWAHEEQRHDRRERPPREAEVQTIRPVNRHTHTAHTYSTHTAHTQHIHKAEREKKTVTHDKV